MNIRTFSINKYGEEGAKRLAIEAHTAIEPLLEQQYYDNYWGYRPGNRFNRASIVEEPFAYEGAENYVLHKAAERNKEIRTLKLKEFLKEHGRLFCEICGFCFEESYGEIGRGLIEVHHLVPLSKMEEGHRTTIKELMCICSNCHFAVHNGDPDANLRSMTTLFSGGALTNDKKSNKSCVETGDNVSS
jgi:predicted HNH restriction endonuclease